MADTTLQFTFQPSGLSTIYFVMFAEDGRLVHATTGALLAATDGNWPLAGIDATDAALDRHYRAEIPAATPSGTYTANAYARAGASKDPDADPCLGVGGQFGWSGQAASPVSVTPSADPTTCNCYLTTRTPLGAADPGETVYFHMLKAPAGDGGAYDIETVFSVVSDGSGLAQALLVRGARYRFWRIVGTYREATVPDLSTYALPNL